MQVAATDPYATQVGQGSCRCVIGLTDEHGACDGIGGMRGHVTVLPPAAETATADGVGQQDGPPTCGVPVPRSIQPPARVRVVAPDGDDAGAGDALRPWRTLRQALARLQAGDQLLVRGGTYREHDLRISSQGTAQAPIVVTAMAGEQVIVDGAIPEFQIPYNDEWALVSGDNHLYRSRGSYPPAAYFGKLEIAGRMFALNSYASLAEIAAGPSPQPADGVDYLGPGLYWDRIDGHLYVRLDPPDPRLLHGRSLGNPGEPDPRRHRLHIGGSATGLRLADARHVVVDGLDLRHFRRPLVLADAAAITLRNLRLVPGRTGVLLDDGARGIALDGLLIEGGFPAWIAWRDLKDPPQPAAGLKLAGLILRAVSDVTVTRSCFRDLFDGILATRDPRRLAVLHNRFEHVVDDALQLGTAASHVEFAYNLVLGPSVSHHASGPALAPGTKYIHHNVIDVRFEELYGRQGQDGPGWRFHIPFPRHGMLSLTLDPWKIYNNTILFEANTNAAGAGQNRAGLRAGPPHEVYNNIFVVRSGGRVARGERVDDGAEILDGNLYHRPPSLAYEPLMIDWQNAGQSRDFWSLAEFRASSLAEATRAYYPPGWESRGVQADPLLRDPADGDYRPLPDGPAAEGAIDLSATGWPGATGAGFRGAVDPGMPTEFDTVGSRLRASWRMPER